MIISDEYKFCFIHIPKCAGSTVRAVLDKYDSRANFYWLKKEVDNKEVVHFAHLTPGLLRKWCADDFERVNKYQSFALVRNPVDRFRSAFKQFLSEDRKKRFDELSSREMRSELDDVITALTQGVQLNPRYVHFTRQVDFVYFQGQRFIDKLYPLSDLEALYRDIESIIGHPLQRSVSANGVERKNVSRRVYRNELMHRTLSSVRPYVAKCLPMPIKDSLRPIFFVSPSTRRFTAFESEYVRDFVNNYYAKDIELYEQLEAGKLS
jgi:hypothetical protein